ncbi:hypothetical protein BAUCODRAFT_562440 [Baudoinia panamericana UAMH 10762]|uniref:Uncharacterized protein n=1 Tax=Baudoinia panamericana (strain UAMH 10762) TaxID=717646 RepID=M2N7L6_BAUPA|nr:uncharacterized protein BAUCODRAFT_562440 [Baudoinia panamericana UAMH 10762]EMC94800.1 hypothetical protein BAUCODRAFT_562440 [Baudoinia panamericana UAMH 10762]
MREVASAPRWYIRYATVEIASARHCDIDTELQLDVNPAVSAQYRKREGEHQELLERLARMFELNGHIDFSRRRHQHC